MTPNLHTQTTDTMDYYFDDAWFDNTYVISCIRGKLNACVHYKTQMGLAQKGMRRHKRAVWWRVLPVLDAELDDVECIGHRCVVTLHDVYAVLKTPGIKRSALQAELQKGIDALDAVIAKFTAVLEHLVPRYNIVAPCSLCDVHYAVFDSLWHTVASIKGDDTADEVAAEAAAEADDMAAFFATTAEVASTDDEWLYFKNAELCARQHACVWFNRDGTLDKYRAASAATIALVKVIDAATV